MHTTRHNSAVRLSCRVAILLLAVWGLARSFPDLLAQGCAMCQTVMPHLGDPMARGMFLERALSHDRALRCRGFDWRMVCFYETTGAHTRVQRTTAPVYPLKLAYVQKEGQP